MRFLIIIPGSTLLLIVIFLIGVTRTTPDPEVLYPNPETAKEFLRRGDLHGNAQDHEKALADYIQAAKLEPDDSSAYLGQAVALSALDRHEEALEQYQRVRQIDLQNGTSTHLLDYMIEQEQQKALENP